MFCPRCGEEVKAGSRYCAACGANLRAAGGKAKSRSLRDRLAGMIVRSRRERIVTAATVGAIVVAVAAFIALDTEDVDDSGVLAIADARAADAACLEAKEQIAIATENAVEEGEGIEEYSADVLRAVVEFRSRVRGLPPSAGIRELDEALREAAIEAGALARVARESPDAVVAQARRVDMATAEVEEVIDGLPLANCAEIEIVFRPPPG